MCITLIVLVCRAVEVGPAVNNLCLRAQSKIFTHCALIYVLRCTSNSTYTYWYLEFRQLDTITIPNKDYSELKADCTVVAKPRHRINTLLFVSKFLSKGMRILMQRSSQTILCPFLFEKMPFVCKGLLLSPRFSFISQSDEKMLRRFYTKPQTQKFL